MFIEDILNYYEDIKEDLKFQGMSHVRIKIMICLCRGSKKTKDLRKFIGIPSSTILHAITELEKQNFISRKGDDFFLTETGEITVLKLIDTIKTLVSLKKFQKLWLNHEIEAIPRELLTKIGYLSSSELIEAESDDMLKTHGIHIQVILNSKEIKGVSPIFYPDYTETFNNILNKNAEVELILTEDVLKKTIQSQSPEDLKELKRLIWEEKLKLWEIKEDIKVAFTVTDKTMTLGLFSTSGKYDSTRLLKSDDENALKWGNELFDYYLKRAQKVNL